MLFHSLDIRWSLLKGYAFFFIFCFFFISPAKFASSSKKHSAFNCTTEFGNFPDPYSCEAYWICSNGNALAASCGFGLIFSHKTHNCDWAKPETCTMINGQVVRDWSPATIPPLSAAEQEKIAKIEIARDEGFNHQMKAVFMTFDPNQSDSDSEQPPAENASRQTVELRFNISRKGTPKTIFEQYQQLVAQWKRAQKKLIALGYTSTAKPVLTTREPPLLGSPDYRLSDTVTPAPKKRYTLKPIGDVPMGCSAQRCRLPDCYCNASFIPGGLQPKQTPQIVLLSFDDAINGGNIDLMNKLLSPERLNPNRCPVTGTFFLANPWTDYNLVKNMSQRGHEIASHSLTHQDMSSFTYEQWRNEMIGEMELTSKMTGINSSSIVGMRAPFLSIGGDTQFRLLWDYGFLYDSSIPSSQTNPPLWPYTFDSPMPHACFQEPCPKGYYPGLWEVPLTYFIGMNDMACSMYDACTFPSYPDEIADLYFTNFMKHYTTNRAPFVLASHTAWYLNSNQRAEGMRIFMDRVLKLGDVYFVTYKQALQWIQHPTSLSQIADFEPWKCANPGEFHEFTTPPPFMGLINDQPTPTPLTDDQTQFPEITDPTTTVTTTETSTSTTTATTSLPVVISSSPDAHKSHVSRHRRRRRRRRSSTTTSTSTTTTTTTITITSTALPTTTSPGGSPDYYDDPV